MRTYILSALTIATFGLVALAPAAHAENGAWQCMSPAFACGDAPAAKSHRSYQRSGERTSRRQASAKRNTPRVAKHETVKTKNAYKSADAKIDLPEKKAQTKIEAAPKAHVPAEHKQASLAPSETKPELQKKPEVAARSGETDQPLRITSTQSGMASYYWEGQMTASGARFNPQALTAAHRSLPFGTKVRVTNKRNGKSVVVTINDRGPFIRGRIIDLSSAAAGVIGMKGAGVASVTVERIARN
jgi:rare lipoprotein A